MQMDVSVIRERGDNPYFYGIITDRGLNQLEQGNKEIELGAAPMASEQDVRCFADWVKTNRVCLVFLTRGQTGFEGRTVLALQCHISICALSKGEAFERVIVTQYINLVALEIDRIYSLPTQKSLKAIPLEDQEWRRVEREPSHLLGQLASKPSLRIVRSHFESEFALEIGAQIQIQAYLQSHMADGSMIKLSPFTSDNLEGIKKFDRYSREKRIALLLVNIPKGGETDLFNTTAVSVHLHPSIINQIGLSTFARVKLLWNAYHSSGSFEVEYLPSHGSSISIDPHFSYDRTVEKCSRAVSQFRANLPAHHAHHLPSPTGHASSARIRGTHLAIGARRDSYDPPPAALQP